MTNRARIEIAAYDSAWPDDFEAERQVLLSLLGACRPTIEHVGSTAVPGLGAKPIIDVMLGCAGLGEFEPLIPALERAGWEYMAEHEKVFPQRRFLAKPVERPRRFHLHAVELETPFWREHLLFRDCLRKSRDLAASYEELKISLAREFGDDREAYTEAKSSFIASVLAGASA